MRWKALVLCALTIGSPLVAEEETSGVVVEEVTPGFAAAAAGLQPGDVLRRWERAANPPANPEPANGMILHPFDLWAVEIEQAPRGAVTLFGERSGEPLALKLIPGEWGLRARPQLAPDELTVYTAGRTLEGAGDAESAARALDLWRGLADRWRAERSVRASWLLFEIARLEHQYELADGGERSFDRALAAMESGLKEAWRVELNRRWGKSMENRSRWDRMQELYQAALNTQAEDSLAIAAVLDDLGVVQRSRGDLVSAESYAKRSLDIRTRLAPGSTAVASSLNSLGNVAQDGGDLHSAADYFQRALALHRGLGSEGLAVATILNNLGNVANERGDLRAAEEYLGKSLAINARWTPDSLRVGLSVANLGNAALRRGDLATAEARYRRAWTIFEKLAPQSRYVGAILNNLGIVARRRGDLDGAESYYRRSLALRKTLEPDSLAEASVLNNLGVVAQEGGDLAAAEDFHQRSLSIKKRLAPDSLAAAASLSNLGEVALRRGDATAAEAYEEQALALREKLAPEGTNVGISLYNLGIMARLRGDFATAAARLRHAQSIWASVGPGSLLEADTFHEWSKLYRQTEEPLKALEFLESALASLELQVGRLGGGSHSRGGFLAQHGGIYRDAVELFLEQGDREKAFHVLERSRVQGLVAMLAERDLLFTELPEDLRRERDEINIEHDRILSRLGSWSALQDEADEAKADLRHQLADVRQRQAEIQARVRAASPGLASLQYPEPLTLEQTRGVLERGTLLLAFSLGEASGHLFVVARQGLAVLPLEIGIAEVRELVERFRQMWKPGGPKDAWVKQQAAELAEKLLSPATSRIRAAERLVIVPDGPLHYLSFAALKDPGSGDGFRYLVESKPVSVVASATLFGQLKAGRSAAAAGVRVAAFADPRFPGAVAEEATEEPVLRSVVRDGFELAPLPGTRAEVAALQRLYPERSTLYLGPEATEETAKSVGKEPTILHFATHGLIDDRQPLSSALVLSIPETWQAGRDNGLLQAWEVFEQVRIDADLVTLSGCETALGKEGGGEGLLGLTRAFQYAGARTVLASLWAVSDASTAALMERFYRHLRSGKSKDQALRAAQLELLAGPIAVGEGEARREVDFSHPFFWAPFQVIGDWQ